MTETKPVPPEQVIWSESEAERIRVLHETQKGTTLHVYRRTREKFWLREESYIYRFILTLSKVIPNTR